MSSLALKFFSRPLGPSLRLSGSITMPTVLVPPVGSFVEVFFFARGARLTFFRGVVVSRSFLRRRLVVSNFNHRVTMSFCLSAPSFAWVTVIRSVRGQRRIRKFS